jgi:DivIVA domain-containing protein
MALTPEDVVNKRFQPTKFREGYDQDEVDDFLDEIVIELRRLTQENEELRAKAEAVASRADDSGVVAAAPSTGDFPVAPAPSAAPASSADDILDEAQSSNSMLQLARRLHEEHVREGVTKRDALIAEGHATATKIVADAEATANAQITKYEIQIAELESKTNELAAFEAEYRLRLRTYIEGQLRDLEATTTPAAS